MTNRFEKYGLEFEEYGTKKNNTLISVFCLTYNHSKYIRETLEGFRTQITKVPIEVFIYDDSSTDGTSEIVKEFCVKYPVDAFY